MDRTQNFLITFFIAGVVGYCATLILGSWVTIDQTSKKMFSDPPKPALKPLRNLDSKGVGTDPESSPLQVLTGGCISIIGQLLFQLIILVFMYVLISYAFSQVAVAEGVFGGVLFAAIIGVLLQQFRYNWKKIADLFKKVTNPPEPNFKPITPPNEYHSAAAPDAPACSVVLNGTAELVFRFIYLVVITFLLYLSLRAAFFYLEYGTIFSPAGGEGFGT